MTDKPPILPKYIDINIGDKYILRLVRNRWGRFELPLDYDYIQTVQKDLDVLFPRNSSQESN